VPIVESLNIGVAKSIRTKSGMTGIDKVPTTGPVRISPPGPKGSGGSGLSGDVIVDTRHHGGDDQAVYAYAREDLDWWQEELAGPIRSGMFGENLTTLGLDVSGALIGERWRVGQRVVLQVTAPRIPCATFAVWMGKKGWLKTFTRRAAPGAYLRVVAPGEIRANDEVSVEFRPGHRVTIAMAFRALTTEPERFPELLGASDYLIEAITRRVNDPTPFALSSELEEIPLAPPPR
jgi:MOSC domain-containing protein YiiM